MNTVYILFATISLTGSAWAANSWADENDIGQPRYDPLPPVLQPPIFNFHMNTPPIFGTKYFGNAPSYIFKPLPPVFVPPVQKPASPPVKDATLLCAAILCTAPSTCRLVQSCPTCVPKPACLAPAAVPQNFDQCCQMHGFRQTVMLHHLSPAAGMIAASINPTAPTSLRCIPWLPSLTRGGCSQGAACVPYTQPGAPAGTGTCCAGPIASPARMAPNVAPHQGPMTPYVAPQQAPLSSQVAMPSLPTLPSTAAASVVPMHAHRQALLINSPAAATPSNKLGTCPSVTYMASSCSGVPCIVDSDCGSYLKCCPSSCGGSTCVVPSLPSPSPFPPSGYAHTTNMQG